MVFRTNMKFRTPKRVFANGFFNNLWLCALNKNFKFRSKWFRCAAFIDTHLYLKPLVPKCDVWRTTEFRSNETCGKARIQVTEGVLCFTFDSLKIAIQNPIKTIDRKACIWWHRIVTITSNFNKFQLFRQMWPQYRYHWYVFLNKIIKSVDKIVWVSCVWVCTCW